MPDAHPLGGVLLGGREISGRRGSSSNGARWAP